MPVSEQIKKIEDLLKEKENPNLIKTFLDLEPEKSIKEYQYWYNLSLKYFSLKQYSRINEFISYYGKINLESHGVTIMNCTISDYFLSRIKDATTQRIQENVKRLFLTQYEMVYSFLHSFD